MGKKFKKGFEGTNREKRRGGKEGKWSRRDFLKTVTAAGSAALLLTPTNTRAYKKLTGWPDRLGMLTDLTECVGCRSCEAACNRANNLPEPKVPFDEKSVFKEKRRPTASAYTVVNRFDNPKDFQKPIYRKVQCNHCNEPACASACPVRAYRKTPEGAVLYNPDLCFGCRYCMVACPFYAPAYDYASALEPRIVKCTMCHARVKSGGAPACASACPVQAITFGKRKELVKLARLKIMKNPGRYMDTIFGEHEVGGTGWLYIAGVPFGRLDFPTNLPDKPLVEQTKGFLSSVPLVLILWPAILGLCYSAMNRGNEEKGDAEGGHQMTAKEGEK
jgi:Fe-S-cluster-containing dehydrogenase component